MNTAAAAPMFGWMTSLADATRVRMLRLVERHELAVAELCAVLQLPQSTVSRHLKVLVDDDWLAVRSEGTSRFYRLAVAELDPAARRLWALLREQTAQGGIGDQDERRLATVLAGRRTRSQAFFGSAAGQWDRLRRELYGERFDLAALAGLLDAAWTVGDLGCGTGQIAETLAPFIRRVIAVETSRPMLAAARRRLDGLANVELRRGELEALPIDDAALDAAVICLVLHHVAEPAAVLAEAARALRPGGRLLVIDMLQHDRVEYRQQMGHVWLGFAPGQLAEWLARAGFAAARTHPLPVAPAAKGPALFTAAAIRS
ncbi:metalloregulator ArsR/SmtB family transcription factor [bacterium]|nr:metalloregulator ArsR/SmtB family transcription factor [bacterium]